MGLNPRSCDRVRVDGLRDVPRGLAMSLLDLVDPRIWLSAAFLLPLLVWLWGSPLDAKGNRDGWNRVIIIYVTLFLTVVLAGSGVFR